MTGRERSRLRKAREVGYLDACCRENTPLIQAYGLWCWRLKIPMVWLERRSPSSRYRCVQLEMFTSANRLSSAGEARMKAICAPGNAAQWTQVSPHDARWDHVSAPNGAELARAVFRAAVRPENYERHEGVVEQMPLRKPARVLQMASA